MRVTTDSSHTQMLMPLALVEQAVATAFCPQRKSRDCLGKDDISLQVPRDGTK